MIIKDTKELNYKPGISHVYNPCTWKSKQKDPEFQTKLDSTASSLQFTSFHHLTVEH